MIKFLTLFALCFSMVIDGFANHHKINYDEDFSIGAKSYKKRKTRKKNRSYSAIDNFVRKDIDIVSKKNKNIKSPISAMNVGASDRSSSKSKTYDSIKKPITKGKYREVNDYSDKDIYSDFHIIFRNNHYVGHYKVGSPYKIYDLYYYPQEYENYEEIGVASWYGEDFDGKATANGEIYDLSMMTAAHRTLPMPSIVKVTNLANNKTVLVRVNDRGPFAKNRIIDLSKKASEVLDYRDKGTIMVKVELDNEKTRELHDKLRINKK